MLRDNTTPRQLIAGFDVSYSLNSLKGGYYKGLYRVQGLGFRV